MAGLDDLIAEAKTALAGKPGWRHSLCADFGPDGVLYVYPNNQVERIPRLASAECTIHTTLQVLQDLRNGKETAFGAWFSGDLKVSDRGIAEQFVSLLGAKPADG